MIREETVKKLSEVWVLILKLFVGEPLFELLMNQVLAERQHGLSITASSLLFAPRCLVPEIERTPFTTCTVLHKVVSILDASSSSDFFED